MFLIFLAAWAPDVFASSDAGCIAHLTGHHREVYWAEFSPDSSKIAVIGKPDALVWETAAARNISKVGQAACQKQACYPYFIDNDRIVSFTTQGAFVWSARDNRLLAEIALDLPLMGSNANRPSLTRHPTKPLLGVASGENIYLFAIDGTPRLLQTISTKPTALGAIPSLETAMAHDFDSRDPVSARLDEIFPLDNPYVKTLQFSPDGEFLAASLNGKQPLLHVYDLDGKLRAEYRAGYHPDQRSFLKFDPTDLVFNGPRRIVVGSGLGAYYDVFHFDSVSNALEPLWSYSDLHWPMVSRDGAVVAGYKDGALTLFDTRTGDKLAETGGASQGDQGYRVAAVSRDASLVLSESSNPRTMTLWKRDGALLKNIFRAGDEPWAGQFSDDGKYLLITSPQVEPRLVHIEKLVGP